jgi:DNA-binding LacI/PurR family transcriptional regulator/DNA-binding transcriptional regulator YhcF (GntR family)
MMIDSNNPRQRSSAANRAMLWLQARIHGQTWKQYLPSMDVLAREAGVSRHTMWKTLALLNKQGIISTRRGKRTTIGIPAARRAPVSETWQDLADLVAQSIQQGEYPPGAALPAAAKLQARWHVDYRTVRKALTSLAQQRILSRIGARYSVPHISGSHGSVEVMYVCENPSNPASIEMLQLSERQTQKAGVRSIQFEQNFSSPLRSVNLNKFLARETLAGVIIDYWGLGFPEREANFLSLMSMLYRSKKRISIIDHVDNLNLREPQKSSTRVRSFTIAASLAGESIGRHLLAAGHRHAAFLTTFSDWEWSQRRLAGLKHAFESVGFPSESITTFETAPLPDIIPLVCAMGRLTAAEIRRLYSPQMIESKFRLLLDYTAGVADSLELKQNEINEVRRQIKAVIALNKIAGSALSDSTRLQIMDDIGARHYRRYLYPMFERALAASSITAWVCATDSIATQAQAFCAERSVDVPGRISLAAFDNSSLSTTHGLTSYDFDVQSLFHQALMFATGRPERMRPPGNSVECSGTLIERRTTGRLE